MHIDLVRNVGDGRTQRRVSSIIEVGGPGESGGVASSEVFALDRNGVLTQVAPLSQRRLRRLQVAGEDPGLFTGWVRP